MRVCQLHMPRAISAKSRATVNHSGDHSPLMSLRVPSCLFVSLE